MRVMQGIAIGGEAPGGWVFVAEHAPQGRGWICRRFAHQGLISYGILLGSLVATAVDMTFSQAQIAGGLWRFTPFLIIPSGSVAMLLRRWLEETPVFEEMRKRATISRELPFLRILTTPSSRHHRLGADHLDAHGGDRGRDSDDTCPAAGHELVDVGSCAARQPCRYGGCGFFAPRATGAATDRFGIRRVAIPILAVIDPCDLQSLTLESAYAIGTGGGGASMWIAGIGAGIRLSLAPLVMVRDFRPRFALPVFLLLLSFLCGVRWSNFVTRLLDLPPEPTRSCTLYRHRYYLRPGGHPDRWYCTRR